MVDITTTYMGLKLKNPIVASASPLSDSLASMQRLEQAGVSAVVMSSLFEEQIACEAHAFDHYLHMGAESYGEATSYFPDVQSFNIGPHQHLDLISQAKRHLSIPVIASLNGYSATGWTDWARLAEEAGADALELNEYYIPTNPAMTGEEIEDRYINVLKMVRQHVSIPVAMKISPFFSSTANMCKRMVDAGANGLVLFNRFYQPDIDLENLEVVPHLVMSNSHELRLPLRWVAILYGRIHADFAITGGVHNAVDVLKCMAVGASTAMMASELLRNGCERIPQILNDLTNWLEEHEYESIQQMRGSMSQINVADPSAFERANYMKILQSWHPARV